MAQSLYLPAVKGSWQCVGFFVCAIAFITQQSHGEDEDLQISCKTPQFSQIGKVGLISCVFAPTTSQIFWYKNLNGNSSLLASFGSPEKSGEGYTSEEYDVAENGSLIIRNVSLHHDGSYDVLSLDASDRTNTFTIYLITTGSPKGKHPEIEACGHEPFCLTEYEENKNITCSFDAVTTPPKLQWYRLYYGGKEVVNSLKFSQPVESSKTLTGATVSMANLSRRVLQFLSCEATWPSSHSMTLSATVVVDNTNDMLSYNEAGVMTRFLMENLQYTFQCGNMDSSLISVWKKKGKESDTYHTVAYSYFDRRYRYRFTRSLSYDIITSTDTLKFQPIRREDEGIYYCIRSDGLKDIYTLFRINVQPNESPACITPQYSQIGTRGYILCNFPLQVSAVYWYHEHDVEFSTRLISHERKAEKWITVKDNEDYDISTNGSLIIKRVKVQSEGNYTVTFLSSSDEVFTFQVSFIATVPPVQQHPLINVCDGDTLCFTEYKREKVLTCRLDNVRPSAELMWYTQVSLDKEASLHTLLTSSETTTLSEGNGLATFSTISILPMSALPENELQVLLCKATWPSTESQPLLSKIIVDDFRGLSLSERNIISVDLLEGSNKRLLCRRHPKETDFIFLWKFSPNYTQFGFNDLAYTYFDSNGGYIASSMSVSIRKNSLFFTSADRSHKGIYVCIASNGNSQLNTFYNVTVLKITEVTNPPADKPLTSKICWKLIPVVVSVSSFVNVVTSKIYWKLITAAVVFVPALVIVVKFLSSKRPFLYIFDF